jgi:hypothetical protein
VNRQAVGKDLSGIQIKSTSIGTIDAGETDFQSQSWRQSIRESDEDRVEFRHSGLDGGGNTLAIDRDHGPGPSRRTSVVEYIRIIGLILDSSRRH